MPMPDEALRTLPGERYLATTRLTSRASATAHAVVYGGSDVPALRRIRSGLANNPTFFRLFAGEAVLDAVRLSRGFFDLGPFRAQQMSRLAEGRYRLTETLSAAYYQPIPPEARSADGRYEIEDEGRFCAAMSFSNRSRDEVTLTTRVDVDLRDDGADLLIDIEGPKVPWAIELTFRPPGLLLGAERMGDGRWCLSGGTATYQAGDDLIAVDVDLAAGDPLARARKPRRHFDLRSGQGLHVPWRHRRDRRGASLHRRVRAAHAERFAACPTASPGRALLSQL